MPLYLNRSRARKEFKKLLGPANHLIITALIGLDAVEQGRVKNAPLDLHAAWNPPDAKTSARRARRMILDMALVRAVDALDVYVRAVRRAPSLIEPTDLREQLDGAGSSIALKISALEEPYGHADPLLFAMVRTMIAWRNKSAHSDSDVTISGIHREIIRKGAGRLADDFRGLNAERLLAGFDGAEPSFKETASLISAAQQLVQVLDAKLLSSLDAERYLHDLIWHSGQPRGVDDPDIARKRRIQSIWGRDPSDVPDAFARMLRQEGLSDVRSDPNAAEFGDVLLGPLYRSTPKDVMNWLGVGHSER